MSAGNPSAVLTLVIVRIEYEPAPKPAPVGSIVFLEINQALGKRMERATGVEPATSSLGSWHSTAELRPPASKSRVAAAHCQIRPQIYREKAKLAEPSPTACLETQRAGHEPTIKGEKARGRQFGKEKIYQ